VLETGGLTPEATALANRLARDFRRLTPDSITLIVAALDRLPKERR
jgi:hypothetical protein